jgi:hypothetical protein
VREAAPETSHGEREPGTPGAAVAAPGDVRAARLAAAALTAGGAPAARAGGVLALQRVAGNRATARSIARQAPAAVEVRTFRPTTGLVVDQTDRTLAISGRLEAYGPEATAANAAAAEATIRRYWNQTFPDGHAVTCTVTVTAGDGSASNAAKIYMAKVSGSSQVNTLTGVMTLNMNNPNALNWTVAHEFGHQLGLQDRYSESIMSQLRNLVGLSREGTVAHAGYEGNVMAEVGGATEAKNVRDLSSENQPWFWQSDDQVRDWVTRHPGAGLAGLNAPTRIAMIDKLFEGWISDADVEAIGAICGSVPDAAQSAAVKAHLESRLLDMTSIGQRTRVRVFLSQMP